MPYMTRMARAGLAAALFLFAGSGGAFAADTAPDPAAPRLFTPFSPALAADGAVVRDQQVVRTQPVLINRQLLAGQADAPAGVPSGGQAITLNLFGDVAFVADAERIESSARGTIWIGRLRGVDNSQVVIALAGDTVAGNITLPGARYHIRYAGNGAHEAQQIDQSLFPTDEPFVPVPPEGGGTASFFPQDAAAQPDDGSTIDVMVVYTATTRAAAGGTPAIQTLINLAIAETNQSYLNSGIVQRLRLVHAEEVAYTETGDLNSALDCITSTADGCLDGVHALRDSHGADLVSFWVENGGAYCGLGWFMSSVSSGFAPYGFSTVARSCATGYYSFGHELGHNMGARHDVYMDTGTTPYPYAHGYTNAAAASPWRTIMAYNNACTAVGKSCARTQYWSNPSVLYGGAPMGDGSADNQQALDNTALTVANFRAAAAYVLTVSKSGSGTVTSSPAGINCGGDCSESYASGTPVVLTATPAPGNTFAGWSGDCAGAGTCNLGMTGARAVTATFVPLLISRTYVASYGSDANTAHSCDFAHPCRSFAVAFSMTTTGGEILAVDGSGYGTLSIDRSVSIIANPGVFAGIGVFSGGTGISIATAGVNVTLRGLTLNGQGGSGAHGINMSNGARLSIENCVIAGFGSAGVYVNTPASVRLVNTLLRDNLRGLQLDGGASASLSGTIFHGNSGNAILVGGTAAGTLTTAAISRSVVMGSGADWGISAQSLNATAGARAHVIRSSVSNSAVGVSATSAAGGPASVVVSRSKVSGNATGLSQSGAGAVLRSLGNNTVTGNTIDTAGTITAVPPM